MKVAAEIETVLEVTELPDLPTYSTAKAERMSGPGPVDGHRAVYRSPKRTPPGFEVPAHRPKLSPAWPERGRSRGSSAGRSSGGPIDRSRSRCPPSGACR